MDVSFLKKNCGAEREGKKKKSGKLFCGNDIAEIEGEKKQFDTFFFSFYFDTTIFF